MFEEIKAWKDEGSFVLVLNFLLNFHAQRNETTHLLFLSLTFVFHAQETIFIVFFETQRVAVLSESTEEKSLWACQKENTLGKIIAEESFSKHSLSC